MQKKPKFKKQKCLTCVYHSTHGVGWPIKLKGSDYKLNVSCNYCATGKTCLKKSKESPTGYTDIRGDDYYNCKLYKQIS